MQKPIMAVTGDETGKNFKEGFTFCRIFFLSLEQLFRDLLSVSQSIHFLVAEK